MEEADFELVPHTSSQIMSDGTKITTKILKLRAVYNSQQNIFRSMLECLKLGREDPHLTDMSNTGIGNSYLLHRIRYREIRLPNE